MLNVTQKNKSIFDLQNVYYYYYVYKKIIVKIFDVKQ